MNRESERFMELARHPLKFRMFLLSRLPSAFFAGVRIKDIDKTRCIVTVPYKWFTQNPFRSTYFACLSMAAEMSTGVLAMLHLPKPKPIVSMLVVRVQSDYFKKATGLTTFICEDGEALEATIRTAVSSGEPKSFTAKSTGRNQEHEVVAEFYVTWSFKAKS